MREEGTERRPTAPLALMAALATASLACGSSVGSADGAAGHGGGGQGGGSEAGADCMATNPAGAVMFWLEDGMPECASTIDASRTLSAASSNVPLIVAARTPQNPVSHTLIIDLTTASALTAGTYVCRPDDRFGMVGLIFQYDTFRASACTVTIDNPGATGMNLTGRFSATVPLVPGQVIEITSGRMDVAVKEFSSN